MSSMSVAAGATPGRLRHDDAHRLRWNLRVQGRAGERGDGQPGAAAHPQRSSGPPASQAARPTASAAAPTAVAEAPRKKPAGDPLLDVGGDDELERELSGTKPKRNVYVTPAIGAELPESVSVSQINEAVVGQKLGNYKVGALLAKGRHGYVFHGRDTRAECIGYGRWNIRLINPLMQVARRLADRSLQRPRHTGAERQTLPLSVTH